MYQDSTKKIRRRRTCADWMRRNVARRRRRDPATKTVLQLLGLLSAVLALLPESSAASPLPGRGNSFRSDRRIPPPNYELGADAWARERGLEPTWYPVDRPKPRPSWNRLVKDLNRRSAKDRARTMIEERVPSEALGWLREMVKNEDWLALRLVGHERTEEEIRERAALVALRWELERQAAATASSDITDDAGNAAPPAVLRPKL